MDPQDRQQERDQAAHRAELAEHQPVFDNAK